MTNDFMLNPTAIACTKESSLQLQLLLIETFFYWPIEHSLAEDERKVDARRRFCDSNWVFFCTMKLKSHPCNMMKTQSVSYCEMQTGFQFQLKLIKLQPTNSLECWQFSSLCWSFPTIEMCWINYKSLKRILHRHFIAERFNVDKSENLVML